LLLHHCGQSTAGLELLRRAEAINPNVADLHVNLAVVLESLGEFEQCAHHAERALRLGPSEAGGLQTVALILSRSKRAELATAGWTRLTQLQPQSPEAFSNLAVTLEWLGRYDEAMSAIKRALAINPSYALAYHNLGV